jgi:hypothetical protein
VDVLDLVLHLFAQLLVQCAQRLVHENQLGLEDQGSGHCDALLLAPGELAGAPISECAELHHVESALHA